MKERTLIQFTIGNGDSTSEVLFVGDGLRYSRMMKRRRMARQFTLGFDGFNGRENFDAVSLPHSFSVSARSRPACDKR
jgi:hypothetical protein